MATLVSELGGAGRRRERYRPLIASRRFQFVGALVFAALAPFIFQLMYPPAGHEWNKTVALGANCTAIAVALWMRLSIEVYPGIRRSYVIVPTVLTAHGLVIAALLASRLPYARLSLILGVILHVLWLYIIYVAVERRIRRRIAVVPCGAVSELNSIDSVQWRWLKRPQLKDTRGCEAIVADFAAEISPEWETFLAEAALRGRIVYHQKQLSESLTGCVRLAHLSENTFGLLLPSRGYFYVKGMIDFLFALVVLPIALPLMAIIAVAISADGGAPLFRQKRVGYAGREFTVYKFRTMHDLAIADPRLAAITSDDDARITGVGRTLRKYRLDELPQIFNILKWEMSWIGPRPEARALSSWYGEEIPFYLYRHVVKPGISGWAQVNQGHVATIEDVHRKLQYDFFYIKYFSPWLDFLILLRTVKTMVSGFGSR